MLARLKRSWRTFADAEPGDRFRQRYDARRRKSHSTLSGVLRTLGGMLLVFIGAVLMVIPGPGIPFVALGAALIAQQFKWAATAADKLELFGRRVLDQAKRLWRAAPVVLRIGAVTLALIVGTAAGYGAYRIMFS